MQASPINLISNSEHKDTLTAIVLFTALNSQPITYAEIDEKNNLIIEFENKSKISSLIAYLYVYSDEEVHLDIGRKKWRRDYV